MSAIKDHYQEKIERQMRLSEYAHHYYGCEIWVDSSHSPSHKTHLHGAYLGDLTGVTLMLRPLSSITGDEAVECYKFIHKLAPIDSKRDTKIYIEAALADDQSAEVWRWAIAKRFDVFGLIEMGLAIDVNSKK